jgi:sterol desaturase/sphingolipid hydroxylase (fatty acid hydroxylase superfamily)
MFGSTIVRDTRDLLRSSGELKRGSGVITSATALALGALSMLAVLTLHFPQFLTAPETRAVNSIGAVRYLLLAALIVAGILSIVNLVRGKRRSVNALALGLVGVALLSGGPFVNVGNVPQHVPYLGVDWFLVDLVLTGVLLAVIEKAIPMRKAQALFRRAWQNDLVNFAANHFLLGVSVLTVNFLLFNVFGSLMQGGLHAVIGGIPFVPQVLLCIFLADLVDYWTHRAFHEVPFLWRFHAIHHSAKTMDWLSGSRLHLLELVTTRTLVMVPLYVLGFDKAVLDTHVVLIAIQGTLIHANVRIPYGPLRYLLVTPESHHWHHASDEEAIDKNYAGQFAILDRIFGTMVKSPKRLPDNYGVVGDYVPDGFVRQQLFPFFPSRLKKVAPQASSAVVADVADAEAAADIDMPLRTDRIRHVGGINLRRHEHLYQTGAWRAYTGPCVLADAERVGPRRRHTPAYA